MKSLGTVLILVLVGLAGCTNNSDRGADSDGDGLPDDVERQGWAAQTIEFMDRRVEIKFASDPAIADTDGDGLSDEQEFFARTNPAAKDTDGDGLTDCQESFHTVAAECEDGAWDREQADGGYQTDPRKADSDPGPSSFKLTQPWVDETGTHRPTDIRFGDGITDGDEIHGYWVEIGDRTVRVTSDPRRTDTDGDGVEDGEEALLYRIDPSVQDTDGDGCDDGHDLWPAAAWDAELRLEWVRPHDDHRLNFTIVFLDHVFRVPSPPIEVAGGQQNDLSAFSPRIAAGADCTVSTHTRWHDIYISTHSVSAGRFLDLHSETVGSGSALVRLLWNIDTHELRAQSVDGASVGVGSVELEGDDGGLRIRPRAG